VYRISRPIQMPEVLIGALRARVEWPASFAVLQPSADAPRPASVPVYPRSSGLPAFSQPLMPAGMMKTSV